MEERRVKVQPLVPRDEESKNAYFQKRNLAHDNIESGRYIKNKKDQRIMAMTRLQRILWPLGAGIAGILFLSGLYFGIVSWAESPQHALQLFWDDRWIVVPIILGFGLQAALYTILKKRLFVPVTSTGLSGAMAPVSGMMGAGGTTSTVAMVACCAHHVTDVLPILGLTAAATFLAEYQTAFMLVGLGTTLVGIVVMLMILFRERRKASSTLSSSPLSEVA